VRILLQLMVLGAMLACRSPEQVVRPVPAPTAPARPAWVSVRPVVAGYYVGIGMAPKNRPDHLESAKKNALNDLASEISVNVEGNSLLYTLDRKGQFNESFTNSIRTTTNEQIEGFELADSWESTTEVWTYYQLSKSEHARLKAQRKAQAIGTATDLYRRAQASMAQGDLRSAVDQDLRAMLAIKAYWGENDVVDVDGRQVPLANELYADLQRMAGGVRFSVLPERCQLDVSNRFSREVLISATHRNGSTSQELGQLPLHLSYPGVNGTVTELKATDEEGRLRTAVGRVDPASRTRELLVKLDLDRLVSPELEPALVKALLASLTAPELRVPIDVVMPRVYMKTSETNLGQPVGDAGLAVVVREEMTAQGFRFVDRPQDADLLLTLNATTRPGGESAGFFSAYLDVTMNMRDRRSDQVVYEGGQQGVKGVQLAYDKAGLDAYKKASGQVRKELIPAAMRAVL
jgi:hypothetical protein